MSRAAEIIEKASQSGIWIGAAESCTGGLVMAELTAVPGASRAVERGFVTYTNAAKQQILGVSAATLEAHGAVSEEVAREMASGVLDHAPVDLAVSITGIAGPGGSAFKPEGRVCFGLAEKGASVITQTVEFGALGRDAVRRAACDHALGLLLRRL